MVYLLPVFMLVTAYLIGKLGQKLLGDYEKNPMETCLNGTLIVILIWEALILPAIKLLAPFDAVTRIFCAIHLMLLAVSLVFCAKSISTDFLPQQLITPSPFITACVVFALQVVCFFFLMPDTTGDFTVETVNTTLASNLIYENHPGMGTTFVYGITFRGKLVTLPLLYAFWSQLCGGHAAEVVYRIAPLWCLGLSYMVYSLWANLFFQKAENKEVKKAAFFVGIGLLNICGSFAPDCIFYYQMYCGFRGETFIYSILIPYAVYLCYQIYGNKKMRSCIYLIITILGSLCLTDVQKGCIPILIAIVIASFIAMIYKLGRRMRKR
ncbi:MAG TPA: DUF6077 domain-containing protein [Lachnospiraceae bacterium]|nr:DUF6077 domain-containing protein [Lachnospiraceae bacterium]HPF29599.1 DUF6077 domain-containing protein [Lachnospiraceae bacterium]